MAKKSVDDIVRQDKPGFRVAQSPQADQQDGGQNVSVDAASHSMRQLKRKYLGGNTGLDEATNMGAAPAGPGDAAGTTAAGDDVEIVQVQPIAPAADSDPPQRSKAVVVSRRKGKVIGEQG